MSAPTTNPDPYTLNGDPKPAAAKREQQQVDVGGTLYATILGDERLKTWKQLAADVLALGGRHPLLLGVVLVAGLAVQGFLLADKMDGGYRVVGVLGVLQLLVILVLAVPHDGRQSDAASPKTGPDKPTHP